MISEQDLEKLHEKNRNERSELEKKTSFQDKLKYRFPKISISEPKEGCDPTSTMNLTKDEIYKFEREVNKELKTLSERCLVKVLEK